MQRFGAHPSGVRSKTLHPFDEVIDMSAHLRVEIEAKEYSHGGVKAVALTRAAKPFAEKLDLQRVAPRTIVCATVAVSLKAIP
jgi:hypothetical protein